MSATKQAVSPAAPQSDRAPASRVAPPQLAIGAQLGNQNLALLLRARLLQAKLTISDPSDVYEQEADRVAEQVMRTPDAASPASVQRRVSHAADVQRSQDATSGTTTVDTALESSIDALAGRGSPLPDSVRSFMEPRFGTDFGGVRVHTDAHAHELARSVNAQAFTVGQHLVFGAGRFAPDTESGKRLLAHELTHVVQQSSAPSPRMLARAPEDVFKGPRSAVDDWVDGAPDVAALTFTQLESQIDELEQFMGEQNMSSPRSVRVEQALGILHRELDKRNAAIQPAKKNRRGRSKRGKGDASHRPTQIPRILAEKTSVSYVNSADVRAEYDLIMQWLAVKDLPAKDRTILLAERANLEPLLLSDREHVLAQRHSARIARALTADRDPATAVVSVARLVEGITSDPDNPGIAYIYFEGERLAISIEQATQLRAQTAGALKHAARVILTNASGELARYHAMVAINDDSPSIAFVSYLAEGGIHDPLNELQHIFPQLAEGVRTILLDVAAGRLAHAATILPDIESKGHKMAQLSQAFQNSYIEGAERSVTALKVTASVAFTVAGSIAAVVAAPFVAGVVGVGGLGFTGIGGAALTTGGTGLLVGSGVGLARGSGALLGQVAAGHSASAAGHAFVDEGIQGFHDGFLAGAGGGAARVLAPALGVGVNVGYQAARRAGADAIVNGTSTMLDVLVRGGSVEDAVKAGTRSALLAIPGSLIGTGSTAKLIAGTLTAGATAYTGARLAGAPSSEAFAQAGAAMASHAVVSRTGHADDAARVRSGQRAGRGAKQKIQSVAVAVAIGTAEALPRPGFGGSRVVFDRDLIASTHAAGDPPTTPGTPAHDAATPDSVQSTGVPEHVDPETEITQPIRNPNVPAQSGDHVRDQIGDITVIGTRRMEGATMHREIPGIFRRGGAQVGVGPILRVFDHLIADARSAGAQHLRLVGQLVVNPNVLRINRLAQRFGGTATRTEDGGIEINIPITHAGEFDARAMVGRTSGARVDRGPSVNVENDLPAVLYQLPDGIRLVTVHNGEPHYQSLGQTLSIIDGVESRKEPGAFYRFVGAQEGERPPIPAHITGEMRRQLERINPGWLIKGPGIAPTDPERALEGFNFRLDNEGVPITSPAELNAWLVRRGAIPFIDFFRHILSWNSPFRQEPPPLPGGPRQQRQQQQQQQQMAGIPPRGPGGSRPPGAGGRSRADLPTQSFVLEHDEFDDEPTIVDRPLLPAIIYKGKGVDENGRPDPDRIVIAMQSQPVYLSTSSSPTYTGDPNQPIAYHQAGEAYTFFGVAEISSYYGPKGWIIKFLTNGRHIPIEGFHQTYGFLIEGTLEKPEDVNAWLERRGANVVRDPITIRWHPNAVR